MGILVCIQLPHSTMRVILVIFLASSIFARPQSGQQPDPSSGRGFQSSDKDTEVLSIEVLETHDNYEVRKFPAAKWACTKENNIDPLVDPMRNWEEKYDNNSMLAMSNYSEWKKIWLIKKCASGLELHMNLKRHHSLLIIMSSLK